MTMTRPAPRPLLAMWATALISSTRTHAFAPSLRTPSAARPSTMLREGPPVGTKLVSNKKEVAFDGTRFYETGVEEEDCIPDQEFCVVDPDTSKPIRLTIEEKERMFLDSLQAYYASGRQVLDDAEFDLLKEDLAWNGSPVVNLNRQEVKYLEAMQAYTRGKPVMDDEEFDALRSELKENGSKIAVSKEPKCYIDTGICKATFEKDNFRNNLLYLPALSIISLLWLGIGFEFIGGRINPLILAAFGAPVISYAAKALTDNFIFPNNLVAYGQCPSCSSQERIYFGDILGVEGFDKQAAFKCTVCKEQVIVQRRTLRASSLPKN